MPPKWKKKCLSKQSRPGTGRLFKLLSTRRTHAERMCRTQSRKLKAPRRWSQRAAICRAGVVVAAPPSASASAARCSLPHCVWWGVGHMTWMPGGSFQVKNEQKMKWNNAWAWVRLRWRHSARARRGDSEIQRERKSWPILIFLSRCLHF